MQLLVPWPTNVCIVLFKRMEKKRERERDYDRKVKQHFFQILLHEADSYLSRLRPAVGC